VGGQGLLRESQLPVQKRGRAHLEDAARRAACSQIRLHLPKARVVQEARSILRYVTALSIDLGLTSNGSATGASKSMKNALLAQPAPANGAPTRSSSAA
jgi:hypothetical protein